MNVVEVSGACKNYNSNGESKVVLENFNMTVQKGTIYAMMGSSGCGKTTLMSCLVGTNCLDKGSINLFGEPSTNVNKLQIGFMPQEIALINGMKVREMIWFFGTIYGLSAKMIGERFQFLSKLLELPDGDRLVRDCSGGQQRRVSFAVTLVHEPELLILDEPTVGVDPLLRNRIWDYLVELTRTKNVTILLSTHYIEEARQSNKVGIMRNGVQIAEDSPQNILQMCETTSMEEAFLKLSQRQEVGKSYATSMNDIKLSTFDTKPSSSRTQNPPTLPVRPPQTYSKIMFALLTKHFLEISRNFGVFVTTLLLPILGCFCLHFAIGGSIQGLTLGVVNHEIASEQCFNSSLMTTEVQNFDCTLNKVSCKYISQFDHKVAKMKFYKTYDEAHADAKKGKIIGFIQFAENFTKALPLFNDKGVEDDLTDDGIIQVFLDQSDLQITSFVQQKLFESYREFIESLMGDCGKSKKAGSLPIVFEAAAGDLEFGMSTTLVSGFLLGSSFTLASFLSSISMISERSDGTWNRVLAAGVKPTHFLVSHLIEGLVIIIFQFFDWITYVVFFLSTQQTLNSICLLALLLLMTGIAGLCLGLLSSVIMQTVMESLIVTLHFLHPLSFISGFMWPVQGLPTTLRFIGYMFPFSYTTSAFRNVLVKNSSVSDYHVQMALLVLTAWIAVPLFLCFWFMKKQEGKNKNK